MNTVDVDDESTGRRRVVLHPRTAAARRLDRSRSYGSHVRGYTVESVEVFELVSEQWRVSRRYLLRFLVPVLGFLLSLAIFPSIGDVRPIAGIPLPWIVLGPVVLFTTVAIAWRHEKRALAIEEQWGESHTEDDS